MKTNKTLFLIALLTFISWGLSAETATKGKVVFVDGDVTVNGTLVDTGDVIPADCTIKTSAKSEVEILFAEKNIFRIGANSTVKVDFQKDQKSVFLSNGTFTSVLKKLAKVTGAGFELRTPSVYAGVRGTSFHVSTDGTQTYFCTCNGSVQLDDPEGKNEVILTNAHHGARIYTKNADGTVTVTSAGLEGHTDADLQSLAGKISVSIDWSKPDLKHE